MLQQGSLSWSVAEPYLQPRWLSGFSIQCSACSATQTTRRAWVTVVS